MKEDWIKLGEIDKRIDINGINEFLRKGQEKMRKKGLKPHTLEWVEETCKLIRRFKKKIKGINNKKL